MNWKHLQLHSTWPGGHCYSFIVNLEYRGKSLDICKLLGSKPQVGVLYLLPKNDHTLSGVGWPCPGKLVQAERGAKSGRKEQN